mgnify:CR=1 FL=1
MAFNFNNRKNRKVLADSKRLEMLDQMLSHVKRLIKRRDSIYNVKETPGELLEAKLKKMSTKLPVTIEEVSESEENA